MNTQPHIENLNVHPKRKPQNHYENEVEENDENEEELEEDEYEEKIRYPYNTTTTSATPHSRCSKGVSTDELQREQEQNPKNPTTEMNLENSSSPPSTTSSSLSDKGVNENANTSRRFEDGDPVINKPLLSRNSMLFQLIACGGSVSFRGKNAPVAKQEPPPHTAARRSNCSDLHKGVLCKSVNDNNKKAAVVAEDEEDDEIKCMSENPRFGNLQSGEKEYFSGSIVESISTEGRTHDHIVEPSSLKKSSSYNEER